MALANTENIRDYFAVSKQFDHADSTAVVLDIPADTFVIAVYLVITEAFDGSASIDVGDTSNADVWIDTTDVTETTIGIYQGDGGDATYYSGHLYQTAAQLKITFSASEGTVGECHVVAHCLDMSDLV